MYMYVCNLHTNMHVYVRMQPHIHQEQHSVIPYTRTCMYMYVCNLHTNMHVYVCVQPIYKHACICTCATTHTSGTTFSDTLHGTCATYTIVHRHQEQCSLIPYIYTQTMQCTHALICPHTWQRGILRWSTGN